MSIELQDKYISRWACSSAMWGIGGSLSISQRNILSKKIQLYMGRHIELPSMLGTS